MAGLWEFPGGKLEHGESPEAAVVRELREELGIVVDLADLSAACFASEPLDGRPLLLLVYMLRRWAGEPRALHAADLRWVSVEDLTALPMPPADRPLLPLLAQLLTT